MERKRGKLSTEEEKTIRDRLKGGKTFEAIANEINRTVKTVKKHCENNNITYQGMAEEVYDETVLRAQLKEKPYWHEVKKQLTEDQQVYFATTWVRLMKQFRENVLYSEELQIKQWITLELMANSVQENRFKSSEQIKRIEDILEKEYGVSEESRDIETIVRLESELSMLRNSQSSYTTEYDRILGKVEKYQRELRAARADRVKQIEDGKSTFSGFLASLEEEDIRKSMGEEIEINRIAMEFAKQRLSEWHKYEDGGIDQPLLTPENIKEDDE